MKPTDSNTITPGEFRWACLQTWLNGKALNPQDLTRQELQRYVWRLEKAVLKLSRERST